MELENIKAGDVAAGFIFLLMGIGIFAYGYPIFTKYNTSIGQLALAYSSAAQAEYQQGEIAMIIGGILAFIGFIACIGGAVTQPSPASYHYVPVAQSASYSPPPSQAAVMAKAQAISQSTVQEKSESICNETNKQIPPGLILYYNFHVSYQSTKAFLRGEFRASGGEGNDIMALVLTEADFLNVQNNHPANAFYQSGLVTAGNINVELPGGGNYVLVFSNAFSSVSNKSISAKVDLFLTA